MIFIQLDFVLCNPAFILFYAKLWANMAIFRAKMIGSKLQWINYQMLLYLKYCYLVFSSSISWSSYHKGLLASSDYEGTVTLWDAFTGTKTRSFQEHEKRCWSVDFNHVDPKLLASGSDDAKGNVNFRHINFIQCIH